MMIQQGCQCEASHERRPRSPRAAREMKAASNHPVRLPGLLASLFVRRSSVKAAVLDQLSHDSWFLPWKIRSWKKKLKKESSSGTMIDRAFNWQLNCLPFLFNCLQLATNKLPAATFVVFCRFALSLSNQPALLYTSCTVISLPAAALDSILEEQYPPVWVEQSQSLIDLLTNILLH
jgi:hypothetical protein